MTLTEKRFIALDGSVCGYCGQSLEADGNDFKCSACKTVHFFDVVNHARIDGKEIDCESFVTVIPLF